MPATAIDIGSYSIKAISAKPDRQPDVKKVVEVPNELGLGYPRNDQQAEKLFNQLADLFNQYRLPQTDVRLSLPENVISTKVIQLPPLSDAELASAIDWQAEQHIPIASDDLTLEYQVLYRPKGKVEDEPMEVLMVATKQSLVERYTNIFLNLGIQPKIMETQMFSIIRALGFEPQDPPTLIAHLGAQHTQIGVVSAGQFRMVVDHQGGGTLLTNTLKQAIDNITLDQARQYKHGYGLRQDQLQGKIAQILQPSAEALVSEIHKTFKFFNNQHPQQPITQIVLSGGTAQLPGLVEYIVETTNTQTLIASPFAQASGDIPQANQQALIVCIGLLMRKA